MGMQPSMRYALLLAGTLLAFGAACEGKTLPYAGGLMVAVQTDYSIPKDITAVGLYITSDGRPIFGDTREVAPTGEVKFPATIAVVGDSARPRAVVKIRAVGFKTDGEIRVLRDVVTTIPKGRTALLRTPLTWINEGSGTGNRGQLVTSAIRPLDFSDGFTKLKSICPDGQTSLQGDCGDATVDPETLPDYAEKDVFGGGDATGNGGRCFDVLGCFATTTNVTIDPAGCTGAIEGVDPNDANLTLAVVLPRAKDIGECNAERCLVPLDKGAGWTVAGPSIQLPPAMCRKIAEGKSLGIVATRACPAKDPTTPSCGLASAVAGSATPGGGGDASAPQVDDFEPSIAYSAEPNLSDLAVDNTYLFLARSGLQPSPPGVVRLNKADVVAQKNAPALQSLVGYANPEESRIVLDDSPAAARVVVRSVEGTVRLCTPTSANNCPSFDIVGPKEALAAGPDQAYAFGDFASVIGLYTIPYSGTPVLSAALPAGKPVTTMRYKGGVLYGATIDGALFKCVAPCAVASNMSQLRAAPATPAIVSAIALSDKVPNKLFFMQLPADATTVSTAGIFEIGTDGSGESQLANGAEVISGSPAGAPPVALAVDAEYVYWGGVFDDPRGGGKKSGLLRRNHVTRAPTGVFLEEVQGTEAASGVAVDDQHVFWSYNRQDRALLLAKKKRAF